MDCFYRFTTKSGVEVSIRTEKNKKFYFGIFTTIEGRGMNRWSSLVKRDGKYMLLVHATKNFNPVTIPLPDKIAKGIKKNKLKACEKTGKVIIATATTENNVVQFIKCGTAIAEPFSKDEVVYRIPSMMEQDIRKEAKDGIIYEGGSLEDDTVKCDSLYCTYERVKEYHFLHKYNYPKCYFLGMENEKWIVNLRVVELCKADD